MVTQGFSPTFAYPLLWVLQSERKTESLGAFFMDTQHFVHQGQPSEFFAQFVEEPRKERRQMCHLLGTMHEQLMAI